MTVDTRPDPEAPNEIPEGLRDSIVLGKLDDLINWGRSNSLWPFFFGLSCCFVETATTLTARHDLARFGAEVMRGSPRQADVMIIAGTPFKKMGPSILRLYEQMLEPRWVVSMGSCSNSGGMFDVYSVIQGVDTILPVDAYVQGCPPRPESLIQALTLLQGKIRRNEKPTRQMLRMADHNVGTTRPPRIQGQTTTYDPRGPGLEGTRPRGTILRPNSDIPAAYFPTWTPPSPVTPNETGLDGVEAGLKERIGGVHREAGPTDTVTWKVKPEQLITALHYLRNDAKPRFQRLEFAAGLDNRPRGAGFRTIYHLTAVTKNKPQVRVAVDMGADNPRVPTVTGVYPGANWYEREIWDMFGIRIDGHPDPRRIFMPSCWEGHPLRKDHPYRGSEMKPFTHEDAEIWDRAIAEHSRIKPGPGSMVLNLGPHHPGTHGVLRFVLRLDGESVDDVDVDLGYHHRGPEKIAERQTYHRFIPYTDRVDYVSGVANNLPYVMAVEKLLGVEVPPRAQAIRVLLCEIFRIINHLVFVGTFAQDAGALTPVFYTFEAREQLLDFISKVTGGRMHPNWFRIGGTCQDLPDGWLEDMRAWVKRFPRQWTDVDKLVTGNPIFVGRTKGVGRISTDEAHDYGYTGANLRACGVEWDLRKVTPYMGYENYEFDIPTGSTGDNFDRYWVRMQEMMQSHRIISQVVENMPDGPYVAQGFRYSVPEPKRMLHDIESLIHHFVNVSRGFVPPPGEAYVATESSKGECGYYVVSNGSNLPYRVFIRTPSFPHLQSTPLITKGELVSDMVITLGAIDFVLADIDK